MQPELACPKFQKEMETFDIFITWKISWEKKFLLMRLILRRLHILILLSSSTSLLPTSFYIWDLGLSPILGSSHVNGLLGDGGTGLSLFALKRRQSKAGHLPAPPPFAVFNRTRTPSSSPLWVLRKKWRVFCQENFIVTQRAGGPCEAEMEEKEGLLTPNRVSFWMWTEPKNIAPKRCQYCMKDFLILF